MGPDHKHYVQALELGKEVTGFHLLFFHSSCSVMGALLSGLLARLLFKFN